MLSTTLRTEACSTCLMGMRVQPPSCPLQTPSPFHLFHLHLLIHRLLPWHRWTDCTFTFTILQFNFTFTFWIHILFTFSFPMYVPFTFTFPMYVHLTFTFLMNILFTFTFQMYVPFTFTFPTYVLSLLLFRCIFFHSNDQMMITRSRKKLRPFPRRPPRMAAYQRLRLRSCHSRWSLWLVWSV